ncbi:MAG: hypothetical protein ACKVP7_08500 [Hyphomicrobiaceae bacterium]
MSTAAPKSFDAALDFMPATATGGKGPLSAIKTFFSGITEGLEAERLYRQNLSRGMTPTAAAALAFDTAFKPR